MKTGFKILLATDYSDAVMNAERYAVQFAIATDSSIAIMHVYDFPIGPPMEAWELSKLNNNIVNMQIDELKQHRNRLYKSLGLDHKAAECECIASEGAPSAEILKKAGQMEFDMIFAGAHGQSGLQGKLMGNHAFQLIKKSQVPVMIIPENGLLTEMKKIVFAAETRLDEIDVIQQVAAFAKLFNAKLFIVHATNDSVSKEFATAVFNEFGKEVKEKVTYPEMSFHLVHHHDIADALNIFCEEESADLLVLSPKKRRIIDNLFLPESVSKKLSTASRRAFLCLPESFVFEMSEVTTNSNHQK